MAINPNLLVAAAMLQDMLVDKDTGLPLSGGIVSLYIDTARSFYKNWYYQTGQPGAYTYIPLDNPLTLSSAGTIQDPNGNDIIPFYYPFDEENQNQPQAYYITVYSADSDGNPAELEFTRENFPFQPSNVSPTVENPTWRNYITNNVYWRNVGSQNLTNVTNMVIAPSQHEGYASNHDIRFLKNTTGGQDSLAFNPMTVQLDNDITPEVCLSMQCTNTQLGETQKCVQYPVSLHVNTLNAVTGVIKIHAQNVAGNPNNFLDLYFYQFLGTGAITQPAPILIQRIVLNNDFQEFLVPFITPSTEGLTLGAGGDDALFLQVQFPLSAAFNINHTKPQIYLSTDVPDNDFDTYDQIEAIINSPRTGDYKHSLNSFVPFGYVAANDGSIGSASSGATSRANTDTWPLYNLLWNSVLNNWAPVAGGRGATAIADFSANKAMTLTRILGRVIAGLNPVLSTPQVFTVAFGTSNTNINLASNIVLTTGTPIQFNTTGGLPTGLSTNTVYFVYNPTNSATTIQVAATLDNAYAGTPLVTFSSNGSGTNTIVNALGIYVGESMHTLTINEMPSHNHPGSSATGPGSNNDSGDGFIEGQGVNSRTYPINLTIAPQGNGASHNILQPTTYANVFIKL